MLISEITRNALLLKVSPEYINRVCAHSIQKGIKRGCPPPMLLFYAAEIMGQYWIPESIDFQKVLESMKDADESKKHNSDNKDKMLMKNGAWPRKQVFAFGWFEDSSEVDDILTERCLNYPDLKDDHAFAEAMALIINVILLKKRIVWAERLLMTAIRAFSSQGSHKRHGNDFFIIAQDLYNSKIPLEEIPLMIAVAELSVRSAIKRAKIGTGQGIV